MGKQWLCIGYGPHTVTVYNRATIKGLIYLYYEYYPTVTEWGPYPSFADKGLGPRGGSCGNTRSRRILIDLLSLHVPEHHGEYRR